MSFHIAFYVRSKLFFQDFCSKVHSLVCVIVKEKWQECNKTMRVVRIRRMFLHFSPHTEAKSSQKLLYRGILREFVISTFYNSLLKISKKLQTSSKKFSVKNEVANRLFLATSLFLATKTLQFTGIDIDLS